MFTFSNTHCSHYKFAISLIYNLYPFIHHPVCGYLFPFMYSRSTFPSWAWLTAILTFVVGQCSTSLWGGSCSLSWGRTRKSLRGSSAPWLVRMYNRVDTGWCMIHNGPSKIWSIRNPLPNYFHFWQRSSNVYAINRSRMHMQLECWVFVSKFNVGQSSCIIGAEFLEEIYGTCI